MHYICVVSERVVAAWEANHAWGHEEVLCARLKLPPRQQQERTQYPNYHRSVLPSRRRCHLLCGAQGFRYVRGVGLQGQVQRTQSPSLSLSWGQSQESSKLPQEEVLRHDQRKPWRYRKASRIAIKILQLDFQREGNPKQRTDKIFHRLVQEGSKKIEIVLSDAKNELKLSAACRNMIRSFRYYTNTKTSININISIFSNHCSYLISCWWCSGTLIIDWILSTMSTTSFTFMARLNRTMDC